MSVLIQPKRGWVNCCSMIRSSRAIAIFPARAAITQLGHVRRAQPRAGGEGGATGLGAKRHVTLENTPEQRIPPRNSPALFNLGAKQFTTLFHDGRIGVDPTRPSGLRTPMEEEMVTGFASILSAQTMFPVLSGDEMAGHYSENDVAKAVRSGRITGGGRRMGCDFQAY